MNFTKLDHLLQAAVPTVAPALVCQVEQGGRVLFARGYGWINPMLKRQAVCTETLFDFASLTQLFTSTACLRMHDAGLLDLDQPVSDFLPDFAGPRYIGPVEDPITKEAVPPPDPWRNYTGALSATQITFRQLLSHSSGLPGWRNLYSICGGIPQRPNATHRAELLRRQRVGLAAICGFNFAYPPGESSIYSEIGPILLGSALAACAGDPTVAETLRNWVLRPLGLGAHFNPSSVVVDRVAPTEFCAWRQRRLHGEVHDENAAGLGGIAGHAGLFGTATDLCRLGNLYLERGGKLLHRNTVAASISAQIETSAAGIPLAPVGGHHSAVLTLATDIRHGLGWMLRSDPDVSCSTAFGPRSFGHMGTTGTSIWCDPDRDLVVTLLTNRVYHGRNPEPISHLRPAAHAAVVAGLSAR
ncbi:MAG: serine hydrolase [Caldilineaceae bacterium]|nr:serine hydrolase [Caldilineaceae bacterium]